jgi:hypothetical protein
VAPVVCKGPAGPGAASDLDKLVGSRAAFGPRDPQRAELLDPIAGRNPEFQPAATQVVDDGGILSEADRVLEGSEDDRGSQSHGRGSHRERREHREHGREVALVGHVVLGQPDRLEPERLRRLHLIQHLAIKLVIGPVPLGRISKVVPDSELHALFSVRRHSRVVGS